MSLNFIWLSFLRLMSALPVTLEVWALSIFFGGFIAAGITWMRVSGILPLSLFARLFIFIFRGSPLLIQLFLIYYGLPSLPFVRQSFLWPFLRDAFSCAVLSLALCTAAYTSEIFRGALAAVPRGQVEAAKACGMSGFLLFRRIILPIAARQALPAYSTEVISMTKATALVSMVTLWDLMSVALKIRNDTLITYTPLLIAGAIYYVFNYVLARVFVWLEFVVSPHLRRRVY